MGPIRDAIGVDLIPFSPDKKPNFSLEFTIKKIYECFSEQLSISFGHKNAANLLECITPTKIGLGIALASFTYAYIYSGSFPMAGSRDLVVQDEFPSNNYDFIASVSLGLLALPTRYSLGQFLSDAKVFFQAKQPFHQQIGVPLQRSTNDYLKIAKDIFVYGVNSLASGSFLFQGFEHTCIPTLHLDEIFKRQDNCTQDSDKQYRNLSLASIKERNGKTVRRDLLETLDKTRNVFLNKLQKNLLEPSKGYLSFMSDLFGALDKFFSFPVAAAVEVKGLRGYQGDEEPLEALKEALGGCSSTSCDNPNSIFPLFSSADSLTNKEFGHVLADPFIGGTDLEGMNLDELLNLLAKLSDHLPKSLKDEIKTFSSKIQRVSPSLSIGQFARTVQNLKPGEDAWLEGGWKSKGGGHLLLYQWVKTPENTYDIYIYNLGAGLKYHYREQRKDVVLSDQVLDRETSESMSDKTYFSPFVKFEGVLPEEIGLATNKLPNAFLFRKLIEIRRKPESDDQSDEIYLETFGALNHRRMKEPVKSEDDILGFKHLSGTCGWFTLVFAALRKHFPDKELWEKMDFQRNQRAFYLHCRSPKEYSSDAERIELCLQGGKNLLLQLAGLHDILLAPSQVEMYRKPIQEVLERLKKPSYFDLPILKPIDYTNYTNKRLALGPWTPSEPQSIQTHQILPFFPDFLNLGKIEYLISELTNILTANQNTYGYDIPIQIERFVQSLPNPREFSAFWRGASEQQMKESIALLTNVFELYASKVLSEPGRILVEQNTAWGFLALIHHLSTKINSDLKYNYGVFHEPFLKVKSNPFFVLFSLKDFKFYENILFYFQNLVHKPALFKVPSSQVSLVNWEAVIHPDFKFLDAVVSSDKKLMEKMDQKKDEWKQIRKKLSHLKQTTELVDRALILLLNDDIFLDGEYEYLANLRKAAYLAQAFSRRLSGDLLNCHKNTYGTHINGWFVKNPKISDDIHLVPDEKKSFKFSNINPNHPSNCEFSSLARSEENKETLQTSGISSRIRSISCHPSLQSNLIIEYFSNNIHELDKIENQNALLLSLFQPPIEEAVQNTNFIAQVSEFVEKGLNLFFRLRDEYQKPDVKTTLFFIQIARRIKELNPSCNLKNYAEVINYLLSRNDLTNEEIQLLHMHRILQYRIKKDTLNKFKNKSVDEVGFGRKVINAIISHLGSEESLNNLNLEESDELTILKEIITSWIYMSSYKCLSWHAYYSQSEAIRFIYDLAPRLRNLSLEFLASFVNDLVPNPARVFTQLEQNSTTALYELSSSDEKWSINIPHGKVLCNGESIQLKAGEDLALYSSYVRVFGDQRFTFTQVGPSLVFTGPGNKLFRIFKKRDSLVIQMKFEGEWYEYLIGNGKDLMIPAAKALKKTIPKPLLADHFMFRSSKKILFVHKNTFSVDYIDFTEEVNGKKGVLLASSDQQFYNQMDRFEDRSWILEKKYPDSSIRIELPRFRSTIGESLSFTKTDAGLSWDSNSRYILHNAPNSLLGHCSNYLYLSDKNKAKILVPCKSVANSKKFAPHCDLDIKDELRESEYLSHQLQSSLYTGETNSPQERHHLFIEYDVRDGKVIPLNQEGGVFLSYMFLAQKEYLKAFQSLQDVFHLKNHRIVSEDSKRILNWIFQHPISSYDQSPSASALALKALLFAKKAGQDWSLPNKRKLWMNYLEGLDYVQAELRLSLKERKAIEEIVGLIPEVQVDSNWCQEVETAYSLDVRKFESVFQAFLNAESVAEKVFLNLKNYKYLKLRDSVFTLALDAVRRVFGLKYSFALHVEETPFVSNYSKPEEPVYNLEYLDFPLSKERKDLFLAIEKTPYPHDDVLLMRCPKLNERVSKRKEEPFIRRSLPESLRLINQGITQTSFPLPALEVHPIGDLTLFAYQSLDRKTVPIARKNVDLQDVLQRQVSGIYQSAIESERKLFLEEYHKGIERNQNLTLFSQKSSTNFTRDLEKMLNQLQQKSSSQKILDLANRLPTVPKQKMLTQLLTQGGAKARVHMDQLILSFLEGTAEGYWALNPHLTRREILELDKLIKDFLIYSIETAQCEKALKSNDLQERGEILFSENAYADSEYQDLIRQFLVYEYRSGIKMRKDQTALIRQMTLDDHSVSQLMMGGGKTTVLASNLLYFASKPGRIAFFIPPQAQFSTLAENLSNMQRKHFNQEVIPLRMKREDLTVENLQDVKIQFERAKTTRAVILTTRETIESLTLEYLDSLKNGVESDEKLQILSFLVKEIRNLGDGLVDEVDVILNPMQETNFSFGKKMMIDSSLINMTQELFAILASPEFDTKIRLRTNEQALLSKSETELILTEVLKKFLDQFEDLDHSSQEVIHRFILEGKLDRPLDALSESGVSKQVLEKASLLKHLTRDVLPHTFSKSTGENYGRVLDKPVVGPYNGVGSPSFTEFGSPWEAMVYHFQTVLSRGISASQIQECYDSFISSARYTALIKKISIEQTDEAHLFKKLFGYKLSQFSVVNHMQEALDTVNADVKLQLFIEANTIAKTVGYYIKYLRSTAQDFVSSFSKLDSFSGTPWNTESYPQSLQDHFYPDRGVQGKIIDTFLQRGAANDLQIHEVNKTYPQELLGEILEDMAVDRRERVTGFIDTGGIFKNSNGLAVAQGFLKFYETNPRIQTVLFFHRPTPSSSEVLMALKKGSTAPIILGSSQSEEIAKFGISSESTFVYYDQTHCEATDILQPDHAINIISIGHQTTIRTFLQGILRLRSYFKNQDVELILPKQEIHQFKEDHLVPINYKDVIVKLIDNQAILKANQVFRSYTQKIDRLFRGLIMENLIKSSDLKSEIDLFRIYQFLLVEERSQNLSSRFGFPEVQIDSLEALKQYVNQKISLFKKIFLQGFHEHGVKHVSKIAPVESELLVLPRAFRKPFHLLGLERLKKEVRDILQSAQNSPYLPKTSKQISTEHLGMEQEIALALQEEKSLSQEIERELSSHQSLESSEAAEEVDWNESYFSKGFPVTKYDSQTFNDKNAIDQIRFYSLKDIMSDNLYAKYGKNYSDLFDKDLLVSRNFLNTRNGINSWFDAKNKYAGQVLVFQENGGYKVILISLREAVRFKEYIKKNTPHNLWLIQPNGHSLLPQILKLSENLKKILWEVNLFNGNVEALINDQKTSELLKNLDLKLVHDFLALKTAFNTKENGLFYTYFVPKFLNKQTD